MRNIDYDDLQAICNHLEDCIEEEAISREEALRTLNRMCPQEVREAHADVIVEWIEKYNFKDSEIAFWCAWFLEPALEECPNDPVKRIIEMITEE